MIGGQLHVRIGWQANFVLLAAELAVATVLGLPAVASQTRGDTHWLREMGDAFARLARHGRDMRMRAVGQAPTLTGIVAMIGPALLDWRSGLAFTGPLVLFGIGHGLLLMPPTLAATIGLMPALAGAAAGIAGVSQQFAAAVGGHAVGWVRQDGPVGLGLLMAAFTLGAIAAQAMLPGARGR